MATSSMAPERTVRQRVESTITAAVAHLPPTLQRLLAGGRPIRVDGLELAPETQLLLLLLRLAGHRGLDTLTPEVARADIEARAASVAGTPTPVARIEPRVLPGPGGPIAARLYVPAEDGAPRSLLVYYHGGGWVVGSLQSYDPVFRFLAREADAAVLAVDYRLAPEHRFPAAVDDAVAAFHWAAANAGTLGLDPARVAVAGDSAGGNLAAVVAQVTTHADGPRPALQLLIYPVTDLSTKHPSYRLFPAGFFLTEREMDWYRGHYLPDDAAARDPRASPLLTARPAGLPPAIVLTAGFDVLRDEGEAYARRLEEAGVPVQLRRHAGMIHGFANMTGVSPLAHAAMADAAARVREALPPT